MTGTPAPRPPHQFEVRSVLLVYRVPARRLERHVPAPLRLKPVLGAHYLQVLIAEFQRWYSVGDDREYPFYCEISYATPVQWRRHTGLHFLKLHGNEPLARAAGVRHYGFPKDLADVRVDWTGDRVWVGSREATEDENGVDYGKLQFELEGLRRVSLFDGVLSGAQALLFQAIREFSGALTVRPGRLSRMEWSYSGWGIWPLDVKRIQVPFLAELGVLRSHEAASPSLALTTESNSLHFGSPVCHRLSG